MRALYFAAGFTILTITAATGNGSDPLIAQEPRPEAEREARAASTRTDTTAIDCGTIEVRLADGSTLFGHIVEETATTIRLELLGGGTIEIRRDRIRSTRVLEGRLVDGEVWQPDPNATRLFFGPTGRSLKSGDGYFSVYELVAPFIAVGLGDRFTLAGGTPLIFGGGAEERVFWAAPKLQVIRQESFNAAVGVLHFMTVGGHDPEPLRGPDGRIAEEPEGYESDPRTFGIAYAVATFGHTDNAITGGVGLPYSGRDLHYSEPVFMIGVEARSSRSVKLVTENYFFPGEKMAILAAGPRFFGEHLTADLGLAMPLGLQEFFVFPLVSFVYNW